MARSKSRRPRRRRSAAVALWLQALTFPAVIVASLVALFVGGAAALPSWPFCAVVAGTSLLATTQMQSDTFLTGIIRSTVGAIGRLREGKGS